MEYIRRWVIGVKDDGNGTYTAWLAADYCLDGTENELYLDENGDVVLPLGTIVIREVTATDGYSASGPWYDSEGNELTDR